MDCTPSLAPRLRSKEEAHPPLFATDIISTSQARVSLAVFGSACGAGSDLKEALELTNSCIMIITLFQWLRAGCGKAWHDCRYSGENASGSLQVVGNDKDSPAATL